VTRVFAELARAVAFILAVSLWLSLLNGCVSGPEGDYRSDVDRRGCYVTVGLHPGGAYTTGRTCPGEAWTFPGAWALEGDTVRVTFADGTAYDLRWDGDALVDAAGASYRRAP